MKKINIRSINPEIDGGKYPVKSEAGRVFVVYADIETKERVKACLKYRNIIPSKESAWNKTPMILTEDGRWKGGFASEGADD